jgi:hypothetical protein
LIFPIRVAHGRKISAGDIPLQIFVKITIIYIIANIHIKGPIDPAPGGLSPERLLHDQLALLVMLAQ